jgi:hypothetical protein
MVDGMSVVEFGIDRPGDGQGRGDDPRLIYLLGFGLGTTTI